MEEKMSTISTSGIPTADYVWSPVKGCPNCEAGKCKSGGFPCWAAAMCKRYAKAWAKKEINYWLNKLPQFRPFTFKNRFMNRKKEDLSNFKMQWLHSGFEKSFPVKASRIAVGWMSDISFWPPMWIKRIQWKIEGNNAERQDKGQELHVFQFLTKFPGVYADFQFPKNCWLGFTATNQKELCGKWGEYCDSVGSKAFPANKIFVYMEPVMGMINLKEFFVPGYFNESRYRWIKWLIFGGQGLGAKKAINVEMIRRIRDDCKELKIPFFFKGWGRKVPGGQEKGKLDGVVWDQIPMGARCIR
jgi:protein gp37